MNPTIMLHLQQNLPRVKVVFHCSRLARAGEATAIVAPIVSSPLKRNGRYNVSLINL